MVKQSVPMIYTLGYNAWSRDEIAAKNLDLGAWPGVT
jgi:hypothetical protein